MTSAGRIGWLEHSDSNERHIAATQCIPRSELRGRKGGRLVKGEQEEEDERGRSTPFTINTVAALRAAEGEWTDK
ncbi:hypothetical protein CLOM_g23795 [Closterium sp. NIES-68]|nr:hypothetical protein CLOM_g23795 [Closterium sp. NIES-68]GJP69619.1 hypothetical protein CLOP_g611 [Closterium sp. NIES-67]